MAAREGYEFRLTIVGSSPATLRFDGEGLLRKLMSECGLGDRVTFRAAVPFKRRGEIYSQADVGIVPGMDSLEDELATRTRLLDYIWAGLPVITGSRDELSELVVREGGGLAYESGDPKSFRDALVNLIVGGLERVRDGIEGLARRLVPQELLAPLLEYLRDPYMREGTKPLASPLMALAVYLSRVTGVRPWTR